MIAGKISERARSELILNKTTNAKATNGLFYDVTVYNARRLTCVDIGEKIKLKHASAFYEVQISLSLMEDITNLEKRRFGRGNSR